jgi:DNA-binding MarR family transcriptional regulator
MAFDRTRSAGYLSNWAARLFARALERRLAGSGVSAAYMPVLFALADGGALTQKALAQHAAVEQPTMAATLNRMERDGLLRRTPDPADRRSSLISLSPLARKKMSAVAAAGMAVNAEALSGLSGAEQAQFYALLQRVIARLEGMN